MAELTRLSRTINSAALDTNPTDAVVDGAPSVRTTDGASVAADFNGVCVFALLVDGFRDGLRVVSIHDLDSVGSANKRERAIQPD